MGLVIPGAAIFGGAYLFTFAIATGAEFQNKSGWLMLPIAGPFIAAGKISDNTCSDGTIFCSNTNADNRTLLILDGLAQATGAALFIWGMHGTKLLIRNDFASLVVTPAQLGASGYGAAVRGLF